MYAQVITGQARQGQDNQIKQQFEQRVIPSLKQQPGFQNAELLQNNNTHEHIAVLNWRSEQDARRNEEANQGFRQSLEDLQRAEDGRPMQRNYPEAELYQAQ